MTDSKRRNAGRTAAVETKLANLRAAEKAEQTLRSHPSGTYVADHVAAAIEASRTK